MPFPLVPRHPTFRENRNSPSGRRTSPLGFAPQALFILTFALSVFLSFCPSARAQQPGAAPTNAASQEKTTARSSLGERPDGMVGLVDVGVPQLAARTLVLAASAGLGWLEDFDRDTGNTVRLSGILGLAYSPIPSVTLAVNARGRVDSFSGGAEDSDEKANLLGAPELAARFAHEFDSPLSVGAEARLRFIGGQAPSVDLIPSPELRALCAFRPGDDTTLAANLGFYFDQSERKLDDSDVVSISVADRITLGASSWNSIPWGMGVSQRFGELRTEWLLETNGSILVGQGAPRFVESPWFLTAGARHPFSKNWSLMARVELGLSARPDSPAVETVQPLVERLGAAFTLSYRPVFKRHFQGRQKIVGTLPRKAPPPEVVVLNSDIRGRVVDEGGRPLSDVEVTLILPDATEKAERTYADGSFVFSDVPDEQETRLEFETPGFEKEVRVVPAGHERFQEVVLYPAVPAGQVRGAVKTLQGDPIAAKIRVTPGTETLVASDDGSFEFELKPGRYTIWFEHDDFSPQNRTVLVEERGVVILNIALTP